MDRESIKKLLIEQKQIKDDKTIVARELLRKIEEFKETKFIIIVSGIRRSGKSTLVQELRSKFKDSHYVNFDDDRFVNFNVEDFQAMYELLIELFLDKPVFFFDEIQNVKYWERFVRRLHDSGKKIYITGSNASMLSRELGTHLTGRHISFSLYPFSFREFLLFKGRHFDIKRLSTDDKSNAKRLFNEYFEKGGFPEYLKTEKKEYIKSVYESILYRDIVARYRLPSEEPIKEVVEYAASNIGKEISFNSLRKMTNLSSATTIKEYFSYLENSYLVFLVPRYSPSLRKQAYYNKKAYFVDIAMAGILGFRTSNDIGRMLENLVFIELKRKDIEIYFHKENYECDFILKKGIKIVEAIQITYALKDNREREIAGIIEAMDKYKLKNGLILTDDSEEEIKLGNKKIVVKPIWKWMLENKEI